MKKIKNVFSECLAAILIFVILSTTLTGCGKDNNLKYAKAYTGVDSGCIEDCEINSNSKYILKWNKEYQFVSLYDKTTENIWSTVPQSYLAEGDFEGVAGVRLDSAIILNYYDSESLQMKTVYSSVAAKKKGKVSAQLDDCKLTVTYDFAKEGITIPLIYSLTENGMKVSIDVENITERGNYVYSVGLLPFMNSAKSTTDENSYLVVPSGSGALMYVDEEIRSARSVELPVYGTDPTYTNVEANINESDVRLPIFGVKEGDNALLSVITEGAELANVCAQAGDSDVGYGSVYANFYFRGSDVTYVAASDGYNEAVYKYTDVMADIDTVSVEFIPLSGENATYSGMALKYKDLIFSDNSEVNEQFLNLEFYGAAKVRRSFLGVPYETLEAATSFKDVKKITENFGSTYKDDVSIKLIGFGESGLNIGKIAGGYGFSNVLGSKKEYKVLQSFAKDNGYSLYVDYDCVNFKTSGDGVNTYTDCARTANGLNTFGQFYGPSTLNTAVGSYKYFFLRRSQLVNVIDKLLDKTKDISGISLNTLGNTAYSDYRAQNYYVKADTANQVSELLDKVSKEHKISLDEPNAYALTFADNIFGIPTSSSDFNGFDKEDPLYGLVVKGEKAFSVNPLNLATQPRDEFLKAVELGAGLNFALTQNWDNQFILSFDYALNMSLAEDWNDAIVGFADEYKELFNAVRCAEIECHSEVANGVTKTVFSNGITVTVNHSNTDFETISAKSFEFEKEGK